MAAKINCRTAGSEMWYRVQRVGVVVICVTILLALSGCACGTDADCDDNVFCNGFEMCVNSVCLPGSRPCDDANGTGCAGGGSVECTEQCMCTSCPAVGLDFTNSVDSLLGTMGDDVFTAPAATLESCDRADGSAGDDVLNATFNFSTLTTVAPMLTGIETQNCTDLGTAPTTLSAASITDANTFNVLNSTNSNVFTVANIPTVVDAGVFNQAIGATFTFADAATSGSSDFMALTLSGLTGAGTTVTIATGTTNGIETLNIVSTATASSFSDIAMNGTTLTRMIVTGNADLEITTSLDANVATLDASAATGDTNFTQTNTGTFTYTGGAGDDTVILGASYETSDNIDGGAGTDVLGGTTAVIGGTTVAQSGVTNIETLRVSNAHTTAINVTHFGSIGEVVLDVGSNGGSITNASTGFALTLGTRSGTAAGGGTLAATVSGGGTSDTLTLILNDAGQAGNVTLAGVETLNLVSNLDLDGSAADSGTVGQNTLQASLTLTETAALEKIVVTGTEQLNINGAITANEVDARDFAQPLKMGTTMATSGVIVTGGFGNDTLFGSAGIDMISGGPGDDTITGSGGNDVLALGPGSDTVVMSSAFGAGAGASVDGIDMISDFAAGDAIQFGLNAPVVLTNNGTLTNNSIDISNNGMDTTIIADLDTSAGTQPLTLTLTGVALTNANFSIVNNILTRNS